MSAVVRTPPWRDYLKQQDVLRSQRLRRYNRTRRERKNGLSPLPLTIAQLGEREEWRCYWSRLGECDAESPVIDQWADARTAWGPTVEHIVPISSGGTNDADNLAVSHRRCNVRHGARR